jgi:hypothetical protein
MRHDRGGPFAANCVPLVFATLNHRRSAGTPSASSSLMPQHDGYTEVVGTDRVSNDNEIIANEDVRDVRSQRGRWVRGQMLKPIVSNPLHNRNTPRYLL